jgi:4-amino-4-deoxy-L-arabinose transferase-like glycosyltransferase
MNQKKLSWLIDLTILTGIIGLAYFITLGIPPLYIPDEGRYAEISREMLLQQQYIIPHINGIIYFEKPPFIYWLVALFEHTFGYSEWSVRAPNALMGLFTSLSLYSFGRHYYNRCTGYFAALSLASSLLFFGMSHLLTLDTGVTFLLTLSILCLFVGLTSKNFKILALGYICIALNLLTKGLIGIIFPAMIFLLWLAITQQWSLLKHAKIISGIALILLIALPWHVLAQIEVPSFFHQYIIVQQFLRFLTPVMHRQMAFGIYLVIFLLGFFPWIIFTMLHLKNLFPQLRQRVHYQKEWLFISWISAIFLFFAPSHSILIPYLEPIMPAFALLTAPYLSHLWLEGSKKMRILLSSLIIGFFILLNGAWLIAPHIVNKSTKALALTTLQLLKTHPNAILINYNYYYQDFPYYTQHLVLIVNWLDELSYGYQITPLAKNIIINDDKFWKIVHNANNTVYIITDYASQQEMQKTHPNQVFLLQQSAFYVLLENKSNKAKTNK